MQHKIEIEVIDEDGESAGTATEARDAASLLLGQAFKAGGKRPYVKESGDEGATMYTIDPADSIQTVTQKIMDAQQTIHDQRYPEPDPEEDGRVDMEVTVREDEDND